MMEKVCVERGYVKKRLSPKVKLMPRMNSPSTQDQQNGIMGKLRAGRLGCWLREICGGQWSDIALQLLKVGFFMLFLWILAELHMVLPCILLCGCLFDSPIRRAVSAAWTNVTRVGGRVLEKIKLGRPKPEIGV